MKLVCVGDILLSPESMKKAAAKFGRYDQTKFFFFGPDTKEGIRVYIKGMERPDGYNCEPVPEEILKEIEDADVLVMHMMPVPEKVFEVGKKLKIVASNRGGTENVNIPAATAHGVPVICNPAHNANAVAEMTIGMIIAEMRNIGRCHASMARDRKWLETFPNIGRIHEVKGSVVGVIGFGTIGSLLVKKLVNGFECRVLVVDPYANPEAVKAAGAELVSMEELLKESDVVSIMTRVTEATKKMMGKAQFDLMKPTAIFVNTARPALVDTDALADALKNRKITGAAIDVYDKEPVVPDNPLLGLDNVTFTCHKSGDTVEAFDDSPEMVLNEIERYFAGETPRFFTNPQVLEKK